MNSDSTLAQLKAEYQKGDLAHVLEYMLTVAQGHTRFIAECTNDPEEQLRIWRMVRKAAAVKPPPLVALVDTRDKTRTKIQRCSHAADTASNNEPSVRGNTVLGRRQRK